MYLHDNRLLTVLTEEYIFPRVFFFYKKRKAEKLGSSFYYLFDVVTMFKIRALDCIACL